MKWIENRIPATFLDHQDQMSKFGQLSRFQIPAIRTQSFDSKLLTQSLNSKHKICLQTPHLQVGASHLVDTKNLPNRLPNFFVIKRRYNTAVIRN